MHPVRPLLSLLASVAAALAGAVDGGRVLPDMRLERVGGGAARVVDDRAGGGLTLLVFFRAGQERSAEALRTLGECRDRLSREPVRLVGIVPADSAGAAPGLVAAGGLDLPVLVDAGDVLYDAAAVRAHPTLVLVDGARRVVVAEPFHAVGACDALVARVQRALGSIGDVELARVLEPAPTRLPGDGAPLELARRHVALARRLLAARAYARAHESARQALAVAPSGEAWRVEGEVFVAEGRCAEAVPAFDAALRLDPDDAAAAAGRRGCGRWPAAGPAARSRP